MTSAVLVTPAQVEAAKAVIEWSESVGKPVSDAVRRIAEAPMRSGPKPVRKTPGPERNGSREALRGEPRREIDAETVPEIEAEDELAAAFDESVERVTNNSQGATYKAYGLKLGIDFGREL